MNIELLKEVLAANAQKEGLIRESESQDSINFGELVIPLVEKIYSDSLVSQIASVQPLNSPVGRVAATFSSYSGFKSDLENEIGILAAQSDLNTNQFFETSRVIVVNGIHNLPVNSTLTTTGQPAKVKVTDPTDTGSLVTNPHLNIPATANNTLKVLYSETFKYKHMEKDTSVTAPSVATLNSLGIWAEDGPYNEVIKDGTVILVTGLTGDIGIGDIVNELGIPIQVALKNRTSIKKYFKKYSGDFTGLIGSTNYKNANDSNANVKHIEFSVRTAIMETKTRKIASKIPYERVQDLQAIYGKKYVDIMTKIVGQEIKSEIDIEVINFLKDIAKPMNDIKLTYSLGLTASTMLDISSDLVTNINLAVEDICRTTKRNRTMFVIADSTTIGYLKVNPWHVKAEPDENNPYRVGTIGPYPLFCDMYSTDNYILTGYIYDSDESGDAGLIFSPYTNTFFQFNDNGETFQPTLLTMNRYGYMRHPQDQGTGYGDSDFFRIFYVGYSGETPLTPKDNIYDIPNLSKNILNYI